ncbi:MAG: prolyl oligopeptidase family serine peptidase [Solirubrobacteraceae bacterium]|nr:prolyl oligopeptidase family serine peptidase [Solirubrobacteraceae bacterium]
MGRRGAAAFVAVTLAFAIGAPSAAGGELVEITIPAADGQISDAWLPGYRNPPRAMVLLPDGYDPQRAYPLLVLLGGVANTYKSWATAGQIATTAEGFPGIIVMPEGGTGFYTDWWNDGRRGQPAWESYHLEQVIPQILARYRIRSERRYHALAGVSMGGLGAAHLGARLPGFFGSIAVISGAVDLELVPRMVNFMSMVPPLTAGRLSVDTDVDAIYGPAGGFYARGHNPTRLAANLRHTRVFVTSGDGRPTPGVAPNPGPGGVLDTVLEGLIMRPSSDAFVRALRAAGADVTHRVHAGIHDLPNFRTELRDAFAWGLFEPVAEDPVDWIGDTVATRGRLWGIGYRFDAAPDRVVRFERQGDRLTVTAAGSPAILTTAGGCTVRVATPGAIMLPTACRPSAPPQPGAPEPAPGTSPPVADPPDPGRTETRRLGRHSYIVYTPTSYSPSRPAPLVVVTHGAQTTAEQHMRITLYNRLAEREGLVLLYPDVDDAAATAPYPLTRSWRMYDPASWRRGGGDAAAIAGMTRNVMATRAVDAERVYMVGTSAGGFMASIMAAAYPDVFAAVGLISAGGYGDVACLGGNPLTAPVGVNARLARAAMGSRARVVPRLVLGGDQDLAVPRSCQSRALDQGIRTNNLVLGTSQSHPIARTAATAREERVPGGRSSRVLSYRDPSGCLIAERWTVRGLGHFWPGGSADLRWGRSDVRAPSGAEISWRFFSRYTKSGTEMPCAEAR